MKCLFVSDLHYALRQYDWLCGVAGDYDVVIVGGDHLDISGHVDGPAQVVVILKYLRRLKDSAQLVTCSGNHDLDGRNRAGEKTARWMERVRAMGIPTDGDSLRVGGTHFTICPWWDGPVSRQAVEDQFARDALAENERWIWVYHSPPAGSPTSRTSTHDFGDEDLAGWIGTYRPDMVLTGHIHNAPFDEAGSWVDRIGDSWVFNVGRQIGPSPTHIAFDTEAGEASWFSLAGNWIVRLDGAESGEVRRLTGVPDWLPAPA